MCIRDRCGCGDHPDSRRHRRGPPPVRRSRPPPPAGRAHPHVQGRPRVPPRPRRVRRVEGRLTPGRPEPHRPPVHPWPGQPEAEDLMTRDPSATLSLAVFFGQSRDWPHALIREVQALAETLTDDPLWGDVLSPDVVSIVDLIRPKELIRPEPVDRGPWGGA